MGVCFFVFLNSLVKVFLILNPLFLNPLFLNSLFLNFLFLSGFF
ncbi:putative membrane protein [Helicobacter pylori Hp P-4d]|uniref:Putative membrane protein n=1 Tax=Helicobacter pylori Hp P-4 TaxID=992075 RepID=J0PRM0_HELPX|nr:putative membrane protein [Helicobacter pylori Hp P-4]EJC22398.1 putative membrane protein [Helicobacter pylori Hp P-4d]EJC23109.1 putative membrane protein [Helicobacter pylori Hp P-4c]